MVNFQMVGYYHLEIKVSGNSQERQVEVLVSLVKVMTQVIGDLSRILFLRTRFIGYVSQFFQMDLGL